MSKREQWREHVKATLEAFGVTVIKLSHGWRLIGVHGDITVTDLSELTARELAGLTRIRT